MADASVRPARPDDAAEIGRIQVETWRSAYADLLPADTLQTVDPAAAGAQWTAAISAAPADGLVLVATENDVLVGFASLQEADAENSGEVGALVVEPRWGRRGHGSRLLAAVVDRAREAGLTRLESWVPERDPAMTGLLTSAGWAADGWVRTLEDGATVVREVRMHTDISPTPAGP
ncbi:MAG: GNAT family N-acetyltransferase [Geodermatophilaceae bacterium]|nr:GNAT family N-acetyltransferase [Geodermatophilaceae bacterium]